MPSAATKTAVPKNGKVAKSEKLVVKPKSDKPQPTKADKAPPKKPEVKAYIEPQPYVKPSKLDTKQAAVVAAKPKPAPPVEVKEQQNVEEVPVVPAAGAADEKPRKPRREPPPFVLPEPLDHVIALLAKKVAILEKRKSKISRLRSTGKEVDEAEQAIIDSKIELLQELTTQLSTFAEEYAKKLERKVDKEFQDQRTRDLERTELLLRIQDTLSNMGDETARDDFLKGQNGAVTITEENLKLLDQLYKLTTPLRVPEAEEVDSVKQTFDTEITSAATHLVHLLGARRRKVLGSSYRDIRAVIDSIHDCGYFNQMPVPREPEVVVVEVAEPLPMPPVVVAVAPVEPEYVEPQQPVEVPLAPVMEHVMEPQVHHEVILEPAPVPIVPEPLFDIQIPEPSLEDPDDSIFSTFTHNLPYTEVLSGAVSSFNFLQESEIDLESPHMDPAVIAAHPMIPSSGRVFLTAHPTESLATLVRPEQQQQQLHQQHPVIRGITNTSPTHGGIQIGQQAQYVLTAGQAAGHPGADFSQIPTQTFTNQKFVTLPSFSTPVYGHVQQQQAQQIAPQSVTSSVSVAVSIDPEPQSAPSQQPKRHFMNVNAPDFQALNYNQATASATAAETSLDGTGVVAAVSDRIETRNPDHGSTARVDNDDEPVDLTTTNSRSNYSQLSTGQQPPQQQQQQYQSRSGGYGNNNRSGGGGNGNRGSAPRGGSGTGGRPSPSMNGYMGGRSSGGSRPNSGYSNGRGNNSSSGGYQSYRDGGASGGGGGGSNNYYQNAYQQRGGDNNFNGGGSSNGSAGSNNSAAYTNGNYNKRGGGGGLRGDYQ